MSGTIFSSLLRQLLRTGDLRDALRRTAFLPMRLSLSSFRQQFTIIRRLFHGFERHAQHGISLCLLLLSLGFVVLLDNSAHAQVRLESGGRWDLINAGLGMSTRGLPVFAGVEQTVDDHISVSLMASFQSNQENGTAGAWSHQYYGVAVQGHYHFIELAPSPFDLYAGLTMGWYAHRYRWAGASQAPGTYDGSAIGGTNLSGHIGGRYTYKDMTFLIQMDGGTLMSGFLVGLSFPL